MVDRDDFRWHGSARLFARGEAIRAEPSGSCTAFRTITEPDTAAALQALGGAVRAGQPFCLSDRPLPPDARAGAGSFLTLTGGTSGKPKVILRTQASWIASFEVNAELFGLGPGQSLAVLGRPSHSLALYGILEGLHLGLDVHVLEGLRPAAQRAQVSGHGVEVIYATPTQLRLLAQGATGALMSVRLILCGGGALDAATRDTIARLCPGADLRVFYGAAETSFITLGDATTTGGTVGKAYPGVEIAVENGEVWVRSPYLFQRYLIGSSAETRWKDGFLSVGELGRLDSQGRLFLTGRKSRVISVADQQVFPEVIEALVAQETGGWPCAVLGLPDAKRGAQVVLVMQGAEDRDLAARLQAACRDRLGPLATPRRVVFHPALPLRASGKVDLAALADWLEARV